MKWYAYVALIAASLALFVASAYLPVSEVVQVVIAAPGAAGLLSALFQMARDQWQRDHERRLKVEEQAHALAATSHMASVAFDKYAEFCEKYLEMFYKLLPQMMMSGPERKWADHAADLMALRRSYVIWVPTEIAEVLEQVEMTIGTAGIDSKPEFLRELDRRTRKEVVKRVNDTFARLTRGNDGEPSFRDLVLGTMKELLGVDGLSTMRKVVVKRATKILDT